MGGRALMLMVLAAPEIVRLLVTTGGNPPIARFSVELVIARLLIGAETVPIEPATEVRLSVALVKVIVLVTPPPLRIALAETDASRTFRMPVGRVCKLGAPSHCPRTI